MMKIHMEDRFNAVKQAMKRAAQGAAAFVLACTLMFNGAGCAAAVNDDVSASSASASAASAEADAQAAGESSDALAESGASQAESSQADKNENASSTSADAPEEDGEPSSESADAGDIDESAYDLEYSKRDKDPSYDEAGATKVSLSCAAASVSGDGAQAADGTVTITQEGVYVFSGTLDDGQIVVDAPEDAKVQIVLAGADIANADGSAIYVKQADKCFITLAEGSANSVSDGASYVFEGEETEPDATIFATCDLTLQGSGSLTVNASYNDAIKTKDDLVVTGGTYLVEAKGDGLVGKDSVKIADGEVSVKTAEGDGIKSSKDDDETKGFVSIDGGTVTVDAADKGVKAETYLRIAGGKVSVTSGDDALHSDGSGRMLGGTVELAAGDDAFHVEYTLSIDGGDLDVTKSYEGLEGQVINMNDGNVHVVASDDGVNASPADSGADEAGAVESGDGAAHWALAEGKDAASGSVSPGQETGSAEAASQDEGAKAGQPQGSSQDGMRASRGGFGGGFGMGGGMDVDESCVISINGGTLVVESGGDGIDSNGSIVLNGGTTLVSGPTSNGDGALDSGTTITANGGTLIAVGSSGMAEGFTDGTQAFGQVAASGNAGDTVAVTDAEGNVLASFAPAKAFQNVVVTVDGMQDGASYQVVVGAEVQGADGNGFASAGKAQGGSASEFTATTEGSQAGFGAMGGFGGQGGQGGPNGSEAMPEAGDQGEMPGAGGRQARPDGQGGRGERPDMDPDGGWSQGERPERPQGGFGGHRPDFDQEGQAPQAAPEGADANEQASRESVA